MNEQLFAELNQNPKPGVVIMAWFWGVLLSGCSLFGFLTYWVLSR